MSIRVLWLTKGLGRGGAERLLVGMARRLDRGRVDVEVAYMLPWKDALVPELAATDVRTHCLGARSAFDVRWAMRLRRLVETSGFDIVHTHAPHPGIGARLFVPASVPIVHTEHNTWDRYRPVTRWGNAATYRRNAAVIAVSQAVADSIRPWQVGSRPAPRVDVVHHGADLPVVPAGRSRAAPRELLGLDPGALVVGTVGNLTPKKDHLTLLEAHASVVATRPEARLVIVGTGPQEEQLRSAVRSLGIEDSVRLTGSRDDVAELLAAFDVFAMSSRHEGLPIALLEAMASGLPVVATRVGGIPEVVDDGVNGLLVPPGDAGMLAAAIGKLLDDRALRVDLGAQATSTSDRFDLTKAMRRTEAIYDAVLSSR